VSEPLNTGRGISDIFRGWGYQWTKPETWYYRETKGKGVVGDGSACKRPGHVCVRCGIFYFLVWLYP
jgi:hypothetical protein